MLASVAPDPAPRSACEAPDTTTPLCAYRAYLSAVHRRDFNALRELMTPRCAWPLVQIHGSAEFGPLFDLWCEEQHAPVVILNWVMAGDVATIEVCGWQSRGTVTLCRQDGSWRVDAESHHSRHAAEASTG